MTRIGPTKIILEKEKAVLGEMVSVTWQGKTVKGRIIGLSDKYPSVLQLSIEVAQFGHIVRRYQFAFAFLFLDSMEELNRRDLSWSEENLKTANPESEEPQKKRKRSVGQGHLKFQTRFGRHAS